VWGAVSYCLLTPWCKLSEFNKPQKTAYNWCLLWRYAGPCQRVAKGSNEKEYIELSELPTTN